jgi:hypothetical protein
MNETKRITSLNLAQNGSHHRMSILILHFLLSNRAWFTLSSLVSIAEITRVVNQNCFDCRTRFFVSRRLFFQCEIIRNQDCFRFRAVPAGDACDVVADIESSMNIGGFRYRGIRFAWFINYIESLPRALAVHPPPMDRCSADRRLQDRAVNRRNEGG